MGKLVFTIDAKGNITQEGQGFVGPVCLEKALPFLTLGMKTAEQLKLEYYAAGKTETNLTLNEGGGHGY